jgi:SAM-dependent methyltransferase
MRVLDVGSGYESTARTVFPDAEVVRLDANQGARPDVCHDITRPLPKKLIGKFDVVFASHVIEHIERKKLDQTFNNCISALKPGGKLWVLVPSLEWAAQEILKGNENMAVHGTLYGGQAHPWDYHKVGFTMNALKLMFTMHGLRITQAKNTEFGVLYDGKPLQGYQNVVVGVKDGDSTAHSG